VAEYLLNNMRAQLVEIEKQHNARISILVKQTLPDKDILVEAVKEEELEQPALEVLPGPAPALEVIEATAQESFAEAEARKAKKPGRRRRRPKKKAPADAEEKVISVEEAEEPSQELSPIEEAHEAEPPPVEIVAALSEEARQEEELPGAEATEPKAGEFPVEPSATDVIEQTKAAEPEESAATEEAKKEAKPRRKSWLQDFLPFS
jgi:hypothetical protein